MPQKMNGLLQTYISEIKKIYGTHLSKIILYGSYARGDFRPDSDVDIMILLDLSRFRFEEVQQGTFLYDL